MIEEFPYTILMPSIRGLGMKGQRHYDQIKWCEEKFSKRWCVIDNRKGVWRCFWGGRNIPGYYKFEFKNEQDAMLFSLRWQ